MLVLSRRSGQTIEIEGGISVQVISIKGNQVKIGIEAPKTVRVLRGELVEGCGRKTRVVSGLSRMGGCPISQELLLPAGPPC